ncbi:MULTISPECIES: SUMF1/EgtB/PvdO family nonheme iron enzyme [unclassified Chelatococcus]|uniref:SUMF1/EgtB/PvdO family nonheme iron enzyme n=1 Tax=unclassified Chelatococcus TaxID=2638111 RepID=UPI001BCFA16D|nr:MULTISPECIES: SUMF1/EgtB/PvdO family nonheme iron enzyme [unclassified Chelatococcus]CAH1653551.1 FGE-sulfatase domain-containing protein [Hyphomicrobiales bacterium]MBS7742887.1 SUMF1/EgtB/PvdO family nonheme iron enzyme [Chelatococcus sp. HY11]MBX3541995.1 SUMF1/EgtB/PvdO family nonheme iron enzyme [Chelatococcus sp.]MCO5074113.1 SUMF1/EgtB/PvdO family nonheme iron enzyme [Chelatococcus sp.]CAH1694487.1 FGE-sulfatase domain-containing protein [Hyphomicrobiales bacterium]
MQIDAFNLLLKSLAANNEAMLDDHGQPSIMVRIPFFTLDEVMVGAPAIPHPAFVVNGTTMREIWISKYQNVLVDGVAQSLPASDPAGNLTFDEAVSTCRAKGRGWHLMTNAEWAAIALWCRRNGFFPEGNNWLGKAESDCVYQAIPSSHDDQQRRAHVLTGTGPLGWSHNREASGIYDLNGNVVEMVAGFRTAHGEIQVIPDNDAAGDIDVGPGSAAWRAVLEDGSLVGPGSQGTLKYDYRHSKARAGLQWSPEMPGDGYFVVATEIANRSEQTRFGAFHEMTTEGTAIPDLLKALALYPCDAGEHGSDEVFINNGAADKIVNRGGAQHSRKAGGVFFFSGAGDGNRRSPAIGFRAAFTAGI